MLPSTVRDGVPRWGQARGLRHGQHMEFLSKMSISPSEAAVTVQRITMLPFRSNFPPRAYLFCCELGQCWGRSAHPALCNAEKEGFSLHTHTPLFFLFFSPPLFFPFIPPLFFFPSPLLPLAIRMSFLLLLSCRTCSHTTKATSAWEFWQGFPVRKTWGGQMGEGHGGSYHQRKPAGKISKPR